jgi:ubiquinone/menaquinone biosynthesis C-methylase UbiE
MEEYESIFDKTEIHSVYNVSRDLSKETLQVWMDKIWEVINHSGIKTIIDLGCGTGRFTKILSEKFNCNVTGVEPSVKMLSVAEQTVLSPLVHFKKGDSANIPAENSSSNMVFLSQVYHHIPDLDVFVAEILRVLANGGYVCIRNSTVDNMDSYLYPKFFPPAYEIDMKRLPVRKEIVKFFEKNNFRTLYSNPVRQAFAVNHTEYCDKISLRGCSDLAAISDDEFYFGLEKLKEYCLQARGDEPVYEEIDLIVFQKN